MAHNNELHAFWFLHLEKDDEIGNQVIFYFGHWSDCVGYSKRYIFLNRYMCLLYIEDSKGTFFHIYLSLFYTNYS